MFSVTVRSGCCSDSHTLHPHRSALRVLCLGAGCSDNVLSLPGRLSKETEQQAQLTAQPGPSASPSSASRSRNHPNIQWITPQAARSPLATTHRPTAIPPGRVRCPILSAEASRLLTFSRAVVCCGSCKKKRAVNGHSAGSAARAHAACRCSANRGPDACQLALGSLRAVHSRPPCAQ